MRKYGGLFALFGVIVALQVCYWWFVATGIDSLSDRGLFGDMFGGFTALVSGLAFGGVIYAILLQSKELALQREELRLTRDEMRAARAEYARSAEAQQELVEKQMLSAQIQGMAMMAQARYQVAAARGANVGRFLKPAAEAEARLLDLLKEAGLKDLDLPEVT